jgi:hypothetical protein
LQRLVHAIESATAGTDNVKVTSPMRLRDKDSGRLREHDVVIAFAQGHHEILIALECRDRSRKVGVAEVEAFCTKCEATSVPMGIIVSSKGFATTAVTKAKRHNIGCLTLDEVEQFDWCFAPGMMFNYTELIASNVEFDVEGGLQPGVWAFYLLDGSPLTNEVMSQLVNGCISNSAAKNEPYESEHTYTFTLDPPLPVYGVDPDGERRAATRMVLRVTYRMTEVFCPFEFLQYIDVAKSKHIADAAVAKINAGGIDARVVFTPQADGAIRVTFVPPPPTWTVTIT